MPRTGVARVVGRVGRIDRDELAVGFAQGNEVNVGIDRAGGLSVVVVRRRAAVHNVSALAGRIIVISTLLSAVSLSIAVAL